MDASAAGPGQTDVGVTDSPEVLRMYEGVGRMLVKSIFDGQPVPARFAPSVVKCLLGLQPSLHDIYAFDPSVANNVQRLLDVPAEEVAAWYLDFGDVGGDDSRAVDGSNRQEYVAAKVTHFLVTSRKKRLDAIKRGFGAIDIAVHLNLFSYTELLSLIQGRQDVKGADVAAVLQFSGFPSSSRTPAMFRAVVKELAPDRVRQFLVFITAQSALMSGTVIKVKRIGSAASYPVAHTCFNRLDLPDLGDQKLLKQRLMFCLDNLEMSGFGIS